MTVRCRRSGVAVASGAVPAVLTPGDLPGPAAGLGEEPGDSPAIALRSFARRLSGIPSSFRCSPVSASSASPSISLASNKSAYWPKPPASSQVRMFRLIGLRPPFGRRVAGPAPASPLRRDFAGYRGRLRYREKQKRTCLGPDDSVDRTGREKGSEQAG